MNKKITVFISIAVLILIISPILIFSNKAITGFSILSGDYVCENCNLIIIVSDALRADKLSCYGSTEVKTPNICKLAEKGVLFENAYANSPWTLPSAITMFTGNYPSVYQTKDPEEYKRGFYVEDAEISLAEILREKDYETKRHVENPNADLANQIQGFSVIEKDTVKNDDLFLVSLESSLKQKNKFYYLKWILDPHSAYDPPNEFKNKIKVNESKLTKPKEFYSGLGKDNCLQGYTYAQCDLNKIGKNLNEEEGGYVKELYNKEVESVDQRVGKILDLLEKNHAENNTIIIFTSDHGEGFGEHDFFGHAYTQYNELIHVPLIIYAPGIESKRIKTRVQHLDLMSTIADLLGIREFQGSQGESYEELFFKDSMKEKDIFTESTKAGNKVALLKDNFKLIINKNKETIELYNFIEDKGELKDLSKKNREIVDKMKEQILEIESENLNKRQENKQGAEIEMQEEIDRETLEELKSLGYLT